MNNLQKDILNKIKAGEVHMKPKWHFVLKGALWLTATVAVALVAVYLLSFVFFLMRESGLLFAPLYGWAGLMLIVISSPWILIGVVGVFLGVLYLLVSHYSFSYQKPLVYSMVGSVLLVIALSSLIQATSFHGRAGDFVARHGVPGLAPMYKGASEKPARDITAGVVIELTDEGFVIVTSANEYITVRVTQQTRMPRKVEVSVGDTVQVFGPRTSQGIINSFGVRTNIEKSPDAFKERSKERRSRQ